MVINVINKYKHPLTEYLVGSSNGSDVSAKLE